MSDAPVLVDPVANFFNTLISGLVTNVGAPVLETALETQVPFLALPVVKQIFEAIVGELAGKFSVAMQDGSIQIIFAIEQSSRLYQLGNSLMQIHNAAMSGDQNAVDIATQNAVNQWGNAIHFPGLAPVVS